MVHREACGDTATPASRRGPRGAAAPPRPAPDAAARASRAPSTCAVRPRGPLHLVCIHPGVSRHVHPPWHVLAEPRVGTRGPRAARRSNGWPGCSRATAPHTAPHGTPSERPRRSAARASAGSQQRSGTHILAGTDTALPVARPAPPPLPYLAKRDLRAVSRPQVPRPLVNWTHLSTAADARPKSLFTEWPSSCTQSMSSPCSWSASVDKGKPPQAGAPGTPRGPPAPSAGMRSARGTVPLDLGHRSRLRGRRDEGTSPAHGRRARSHPGAHPRGCGSCLRD